MVVAIDGPAGSGKSTVAKLLAQKLAGKTDTGFIHLNSGGLYRAITLACLRSGTDPHDPEKTFALAGRTQIDYREGRLVMNGEDVTDLLHTDEIDKGAPPLSAHVPLRHLVNDIIRKIADGKNIVTEGRDMTSVVFPDSPHRFYIDASAQARAQRRFDQGVSGFGLEEIKTDIEKRDEIDRNKAEGSLKLSPGVVYIDTSHLTAGAVCAILEEEIKKQGQKMAQMEVVTPSQDGADTGTAKGENIQAQLEESLKSFGQLEEGQLVDGEVIEITQDQVFVSVGGKSDGKIPIGEFRDKPDIGDTVSVVVVTKENKRGELVLSKQKADAKISWKNMRQAFESKAMVEGVIEKLVKGGYDVNLGAGIRAFLPISQSDVQKVDRPEKFLGLKTQFHIERLYSDGKVNIVVNRRKYMEEELEKKRGGFFENTPIGADVTGVVKSFTSFGAFIDLGGFDGLLHINDMSWGHVTRPKDFVKKGQEIKLKVIRVDPAEKRINLSLKHFTDDPWVHFESKFKVNDIVKGKVTKLTDFGAFIEIEEGIEGLAHISEFSWVKKVQKPQDIVKPNDIVECMILGYDLQAGRVSLGLKQVTANPWDEIEQHYPVGTRITRPVVKITNAGAFVQLDEGIDAFLHADDISWTKKVKYPGSELSVGQEIDVIVTAVDKNSRNIRVGIKQLSEDPWESFSQTYRPGSQVEGEVASVTDFGVFLRVPGGIEGLIHKSNLTENKDENPDDALKKYKPGDKIKAVVIDIQGDRQKLAFSIRDYKKKVQDEEISRYMVGRESGGSTFSLGDLIKSKAEHEHESDAKDTEDAKAVEDAESAKGITDSQNTADAADGKKAKGTKSKGAKSAADVQDTAEDSNAGDTGSADAPDTGKAEE